MPTALGTYHCANRLVEVTLCRLQLGFQLLKHMALWLARVSLATTATLPVVYADVHLSVIPSRPILCVKDTVTVSWAIEPELLTEELFDRTELVWLEVRDFVQNREVTRFDLLRYDLSGIGALEVTSRPFESTYADIYCLHDGPFRTPDVRTVEWRSTTDGQSVLILLFSEPTNRPELESNVTLNNAILINHGAIQLRAGRGIWSLEGDTLTISDIDPKSWEDIMGSISNKTFHVMARSKVLHGFGGVGHNSKDLKERTEERRTNIQSPAGKLHGNVTMRMSSPGHFSFHLHVGSILYLSTTNSIDVELCPDEVEFVMESQVVSSITPSSRSGAFSRPGPFFVMKGVLAMAGDKAIEVPRSSFPVSRGGVIGRYTTDSWSLGLWIYLLDAPDARHRGLFHRGDESNTDRTPSAWLCPHSNRIALRVVSTTDRSIDAESVAVLGVRTWNHVAFAIENHANSKEISATLFVNGVIDVSVTFRDANVIGNYGPLHIGRDPMNPGPSHTGATSDQARETLMPPVSNQVRDAAFKTAATASSLCKSIAERLETLMIAAEAGHTESRVRYASLLLTGREQYYGVGASCGREKDLGARAMAETKWNDNGAKAAVKQLELATREGSPQAAFSLAVLILSGLDGGSANNDEPYEGCESCGVHRMAPNGQLLGIGVGTAVLDHWWSAADSARSGRAHVERIGAWDRKATATAISLLHFAAACGHPEAHLALGLRYLRGNGVQLDTEAAAWYLSRAAEVAYTEYHLVGKQPIVEEQRLAESNEATVATGQLGEDDSTIQYQIHRAAQGHVPSQVALGDIYYWGARGVPRDHVQALEYFTVASAAGDNTARCAAAGMYLRGEGAEANHTRAVELYEIAAEDNHVRALNGLGFEYFNGHVLPRNVTRAFQYFQRAADMRADGDSLYNAGHCLASGIGTEQDLKRAVDLFQLGAELGHVDCAYKIGIMSSQGEGVERSPVDAATNFLIVAQMGPWAKRLRAGFDCYLQGDVLCALALFSEAAELGYEVAASNAAFILDRRKVRITGYLYEHGLGVRRDFALASTYYERARKKALANDSLNQHLSGMPIEVLISLAKLRLFLNRLSGGRLASFWERGGVREGQETRDWLPNWFLLKTISNMPQAISDWVTFMSSSPAIFTHINDDVRDHSSPLGTTSALEGIGNDGIFLVVLIALLTAVLIFKKCRRRSTS